MYQPITHPCAWRGSDVRDVDSFVIALTDADRLELRCALEAALVTGKPCQELTAADFPLPGLASKLVAWRADLLDGRGFVLVRGLPVAGCSEGDVEILFWGIGQHLGRPVPQNSDGDLLGHIRDTGEDPDRRGVRLYKTRAEQDFHTDGADLIGLLCLQRAMAGGVSRIVSSTAIFNALLARHPELVAVLFSKFPFDRQGEERGDEPRWFELPICRWQQGRLGMFFIPWYIRESQLLPEAPRLTDRQLRCVEAIEQIANEPDMYLDMAFEPGDMQWLANSTILHKRTAYEDWPDAANKRHLLRLWLAA